MEGHGFVANWLALVIMTMGALRGAGTRWRLAGLTLATSRSWRKLAHGGDLLVPFQVLASIVMLDSRNGTGSLPAAWSVRRSAYLFFCPSGIQTLGPRQACRTLVPVMRAGLDSEAAASRQADIDASAGRPSVFVEAPQSSWRRPSGCLGPQCSSEGSRVRSSSRAGCHPPRQLPPRGLLNRWHSDEGSSCSWAGAAGATTEAGAAVGLGS